MPGLFAMRCDRCSGKAVVELRYGPHRFCREHFNYFFERRVRRTIRKYALVGKKEHIAVALSGGKDSTVALHLLHNIFSKSNKITAVLVDEGVPNYRDKSLALARKNCEELEIPYAEASFKGEFGLTLTEIMARIGIAKEHGTSCAHCGVFRRRLINKLARGVHADKVATGHNLDDEVQSIAMNLFENDLPRLARLGAIAGVRSHSALVPRIKPLYESPEDEVIKYAELNGIEAYINRCCPYRWQARRNAYRKIIDELENAFPGTKYSLLRSFQQMKPLLAGITGSRTPVVCKTCGETASSEKCNACAHVEKLGKIGAKGGN